MMLSRCLLLVPFLVLAAVPARAIDLTVLVDRRENAIAIYFKTPAAELPSVFGIGAENLLEADGTVDVRRLYDGTFLLADEIFGESHVMLNGVVTQFEALSMMVHDPDILPEFVDPYDAELSVAVCTSPETVEYMSLENLEAYLGFYAWNVDETSDIEINLPKTGRGSLEIRVLDFLNLQSVGDRKITVGDGNSIPLAKARTAAQSNGAWMFGVSASLLVLSAVLLRPRSNRAGARRA